MLVCYTSIICSIILQMENSVAFCEKKKGIVFIRYYIEKIMISQQKNSFLSQRNNCISKHVNT